MKMNNIKIIKLKPIRPYLDSDRDGIPNQLDCEPYNPYKQGVVTDTLKKIGKGTAKYVKEKGKEYVEAKQQEYRGYKATKAETAKYEYIIYKQSGKWYEEGPYPPDEIQTQYKKVSKYRGVTSVRRSKKPIASRLNIQEAADKRLSRLAEESKQYKSTPRRRTPQPKSYGSIIKSPRPIGMFKPPLIRF